MTFKTGSKTSSNLDLILVDLLHDVNTYCGLWQRNLFGETSPNPLSQYS